ncbi:MAG: DMT family transporter [Lachnospiraceae bacterium]|nr:DMT family transporter [Lachnospiraceae bacterium]
MSWILLVLVYGLLKGAREIVKKKSLERSSVIEVLFFYTLFAFLLVVPDVKNAMCVDVTMLPWVAVKSFVIFVAWILSFKAIKKMPISLYGILDLSRVLFATILGIVVMKEETSPGQLTGLVLVAAGLLMLKKKKGEPEKVERRIVLFALLSCMLNAVSGLFDKILTKSITSAQLQFWYMLFLVLFYLLYLIFDRTKVDIKKSVKNYWIWILAIMFVIADRALFVANSMPESKITIMTLIKQSGCLVTILAGKFIYKEKNIGYKLLCAAVIVIGIVVAVL